MNRKWHGWNAYDVTTCMYVQALDFGIGICCKCGRYGRMTLTVNIQNQVGIAFQIASSGLDVDTLHSRKQQNYRSKTNILFSALMDRLPIHSSSGLTSAKENQPDE